MHCRDRGTLLLFQSAEPNLLMVNIQIQLQGLLQGMLLLLLLRLPQCVHRGQYLRGFLSRLQVKPPDHLPLQAATRATCILPFLERGRCTAATMEITENTRIAEDSIPQASIHLQLETLGCSSIIQILPTGVEPILGTADTTRRTQVIVIRTTNTENHNRIDPAQGLVSTQTGPHPGKVTLMITNGQTEVPMVNIMQIGTTIIEDTTMERTTHDTRDTTITPIGLTTMMPTETATIVTNIPQGRRATTTSGNTTLGTIAVSTTRTYGEETLTGTTLTGVACTASGRHTACAAPPVITAGKAASAHGHSRARCTGASLT